MHRERLVVLVGVQHARIRRRQLQPQEQRLDAAQQEEHERRHAVHRPDPLVIDGGDPAPDTPVAGRLAARLPQRLQRG